MMIFPCSHWTRLTLPRAKISVLCTDLHFICSPFHFQFANYPSARNWKEENLNFKIALDLVHIDIGSLTQRDEIVGTAINK